MNVRLTGKLFSVLLMLSVLAVSAIAKEDPASLILIKNVNIFDGKNEALARNQDVLIEGNLIKKVGKNLQVGAGAKIIEGNQRTLMPGLMDMHIHMSLFRPVGVIRDSLSHSEVAALAAARTENLLMTGITTVRDTGGSAAYLRRAIDKHKVLKGPRILSAEALITQTSGHGDFRELADRHPIMHTGATHWFEEEMSYIVDGPTEIRRAIRENFRRGANFIKIMATGGISTQFDPLHSMQFTPEEIRAAVEAAKMWKTYVTAHGIAAEGTIQAIENGVMCIEHGADLDEKAIKLMAKKGVWLVPNLYVLLGYPDDVAKKQLSSESYVKWRNTIDGMNKSMRLAVKHNVKMAYGTDILPIPQKALESDRGSLVELEYLTRFMPAWKALRMATGNAGELAMFSGPNNPYLQGKLGMVKAGYYADLLLVDGDPTQDIKVMLDPGKNFKVIMKDGVVYKNTL